MRRALFGDTETSKPSAPFVPKESIADAVVAHHVKAPVKKRVAKAFTPRLRVILRVGNEFEGEMFEMSHETDTISTLLAEQEPVCLPLLMM